jgi:geranylgeranyl reductase family protein
MGVNDRHSRSKRIEYDVIVVGAGPAGAVAAKTAAEQGARVLLLEGRREIGRPIQCTGLLSVRGFEASGASRDVILREIRGVYAYGPSGRRLTLEKSEPHAYVIDRDRFDIDLVQQARSAGVEVRVKAPAVGYEPGVLHAKTNGRTTAVPTKIVIGADGPRSGVARWAGLPAPSKTIIGVQATITPYDTDRDDFVEVFLSQRIAPHFFAWAVPSTPGCARVGLGTNDPKQAKALFDRWLRERFPESEIVGYSSGSIPIGPAAHTVADGVLLVGDAAGQAKPTSGGGIYTGITCARIAGEVAAHAALAGDVSEGALAEYEHRWRALFERELRFGLLTHRIYSQLDDDEIERFFAAIDDPRVVSLLGEHGDIDYPSRAVKALLKRPDLWMKLLHAIPRRLETYLPALQDFLLPSSAWR